MGPAKLGHLPPKLDLNKLIGLIGKANVEMGNFNGQLKHILNSARLLINPLAAKEAEASSHIEGTQATASDAFKMSIGEDKLPEDTIHLLNYREAISLATRELKELPLSGRIMKNLQSKLVQGVRGQNKKPGEWRNEIVWIGPKGCTQAEATYVPPIPIEIPDLMKNLDNFINGDYVDHLVQAAIIHYQFEAIHPFFDGNGRIGRLMIPLFLYYKNDIQKPMLYISSYFEQNRIDYYAHLDAVTKGSKWLEWIEFFLKGIVVSARKGQQNIDRLLAVKEEYYDFARNSGLKYAHPFVDMLFKNPFVTAVAARKELKIATDQTALDLIKRFAEGKILWDISPERQRGKIFVAHKLHEIVEN